MKHGPLVFLAAFFALALSWCGFVFTPQVQLGGMAQGTNVVAKTELYPMGRPGEARAGLEVYRANGCAYCHSQQVEQRGTVMDVVLTDAGKNPMDVADVLNAAHLGNFSGPGIGAGLPKTVLKGAEMDQANKLASALKKAGAVSQMNLVSIGADIQRGWGMRRSVAQDFVFDATALPGSMRFGPDLANVGDRRRDLNWQLVHLYDPKAVTSKSPMPAYKFLFERKKIGNQPSADALQPTGEFKPDAGYEIVPKPQAKALAAYLASLSANIPLYEAPLTPPPLTSTNAPVK
jgi:cbb3-type cytochrome oxidase cytochrome c subunit